MEKSEIERVEWKRPPRPCEFPAGTRCRWGDGTEYELVAPALFNGSEFNPPAKLKRVVDGATMGGSFVALVAYPLATTTEAKSEAWVPMPKEPRAFKAGTRVRYKGNSTYDYELTAAANWGGSWFEAGTRVRVLSGSRCEYDARSGDVESYLEAAPSAPAKAEESKPVASENCKACGKFDQRGLTAGLCCYCGSRDELVVKLKNQVRWEPGKPLDALVAASMAKEDNEPDLWKGEKRSPRERLVAALAAEQQLTTAQRRSRLGPSKHDARERDLGQSWSTPSWEDVG